MCIPFYPLCPVALIPVSRLFAARGTFSENNGSTGRLRVGSVPVNLRLQL